MPNYRRRINEKLSFEVLVTLYNEANLVCLRASVEVFDCEKYAGSKDVGVRQLGLPILKTTLKAP